MILSDGTHTYHVRVRFHDDQGNVIYDRGGRAATVDLSRVDEPGIYFTGMARCSPHDEFVKEKGRRIALGRAMQIAGLSRAARKALWQNYFDMRRLRRGLLIESDFVQHVDGSEHGGEA